MLAVAFNIELSFFLDLVQCHDHANQFRIIVKMLYKDRERHAPTSDAVVLDIFLPCFLDLAGEGRHLRRQVPCRRDPSLRVRCFLVDACHVRFVTTRSIPPVVYKKRPVQYRPGWPPCWPCTSRKKKQMKNTGLIHHVHRAFLKPAVSKN